MFNWIFDRGAPVCFIKTNKKVCSFKGEAPIQWIFLFYESSFLVLNVKCSAFDMCHYTVECSLVFWAHFLVLPTSYKGSIRATEGNDEELHVQKNFMPTKHFPLKLLPRLLLLWFNKRMLIKPVPTLTFLM